MARSLSQHLRQRSLCHTVQCTHTRCHCHHHIGFSKSNAAFIIACLIPPVLPRDKKPQALAQLLAERSLGQGDAIWAREMRSGPERCRDWTQSGILARGAMLAV
eukprot:358672-Chlamydomonas_euryale.AAC.8